MARIYIPVEVKKRAWTAKLLLAVSLVEQGHDVVIGSSRIVLEKALQDTNGVYIEKDFFHLRYKDMLPLVDRKFVLYAYDEEGLVTYGDNYYVAARVDEDTIRICKRVFLWGKKQYQMIKNAYPQISNTYIIGNPRIDLITNTNPEIVYADEIKKIRMIGDYILINSNFDSYGDAEKYADNEIKLGKMHGKEDRISDKRDFIVKYYKKMNKLCDSMIKAIEYISSRIDIKIVLRAHPAEDMNKWKKLIKQPNVVVVSEYDANPWIYCSKAVIHYNCTTAVESYLLRKPVISYIANYHDSELEQAPQKVSMLANDEVELLRLVKDIIREEKEYSFEGDELKDFIYLNSKKGCANQSIITAINEDCLSMKSTVKYTENYFWDIIDPIMKAREEYKGLRTSFPYERKKDIVNRVKRLSTKNKIKILHIGRNLFYLTNK